MKQPVEPIMDFEPESALAQQGMPPTYPDPTDRIYRMPAVKALFKRLILRTPKPPIGPVLK